MEDYILFQPSVKPLHREENTDFMFLFKGSQLMVCEER